MEIGDRYLLPRIFELADDLGAEAGVDLTGVEAQLGEDVHRVLADPGQHQRLVAETPALDGETGDP